MSLLTPQESAIIQLSGGLGNLGGVPGMGNVGSGVGALQGLSSGTPMGTISGLANLTKLAGNTGALGSLGVNPGTASSINTGATGALDVLGVIQGLQRGGIGGYGQAIGSGLQGAGLLTGDSALSNLGGYITAPLAVYNAIKNWRSGDTLSDALGGAEAGAAIGSVVPILGTGIGALIGGGIGAISSAFGGGKPDPETTNWNQYASQVGQLSPTQQAQVAQSLSPAQAYQNLAGVMDAKNNTPGHSESIEQVFGRMGEQNMMDQLTSEINKAVGSGQITPGESVAQQWSQTLNPWLQSKGVNWNPSQTTSQGSPETAALQGDIQSLVGSYESGQLNPQSAVGVSGQNIAGMAPFAGLGTSGWGPVSNLTPAQQAASTSTPGASAASYMNPSIKLAAEGGSMRDQQLRDIYAGPPFELRKKHYDDGGYVQYAGGFTPSTLSQAAGLTGVPADVPQLSSQLASAPSTSADSLNYVGNYNPETGTTSGLGTSLSPYTGSQQQYTQAVQELAQSNPQFLQQMGVTPVGGQQTLGGNLQKMLTGFGIPAGAASTLTSLAPLLPFIYALSGGNKQPSAPALPAQYGSGAGAGITPPSYSRQTNPVYNNMNMNQWLTSAQQPGGMPQFYTNNMLPATANSAPNQQAMWAAGQAGMPISMTGGTGGQIAGMGPGSGMGMGPMPGGGMPQGGGPLGMVGNPMGASIIGQLESQLGGLSGSLGQPGNLSYLAGSMPQQSYAGPGMGGASFSPAMQQAINAYGLNPTLRTTPGLYQRGGPVMPSVPFTTGAHLGMGQNMMYRAKGGYTGEGYASHIGPGYAQGPGDGTSDNINAKLSDGEYVVDAPTVSLLGNGSNDAGAQKLDQMRANVRRHAGRKLVRGKQPMHAKAPEQYIGAGYQ